MSDTLTAEEAVDLLTEAETATPEEDQAEPATSPDSEPAKTVETEETEEPQEEPLYEVRAGDTKKQVPLEDLIKNYQLQLHLDNKLSEVNREQTALSQDRQKLTQDMTTAAQDRQRYVEGIQLMQKALAENGLDDPKPELLEENPVEFMRQKQAVDARRAKIQQLEDERQKEIATAQQEFEANLTRTRQENLTRLKSDIPEWQDQAKLESDIRAIETRARDDYGLTDQEISSIYDHRYVKILRDAHAYRSLMEKGQAIAQKQAPSAASVIPRGTVKAKPKSEADKAETRFNDTLSQNSFDTEAQIEAAADLLVARAQRR